MTLANLDPYTMPVVIGLRGEERHRLDVVQVENSPTSMGARVTVRLPEVEQWKPTSRHLGRAEREAREKVIQDGLRNAAVAYRAASL